MFDSPFDRQPTTGLRQRMLARVEAFRDPRPPFPILRLEEGLPNAATPIDADFSERALEGLTLLYKPLPGVHETVLLRLGHRTARMEEDHLLDLISSRGLPVGERRGLEFAAPRVNGDVSLQTLESYSLGELLVWRGISHQGPRLAGTVDLIWQSSFPTKSIDSFNALTLMQWPEWFPTVKSELMRVVEAL